MHDRRWGGFVVRRIENKLGIKGSPTCELVFTNAPAKLVGERKLGLIKYVMALMNGARLGVGAQSVGLSEAAYRAALKYANEREQFGKKIIQFPAVYQMLALMKAKLDASRSVLYETSRAVDLSKSYASLVNEGVKLSPEQRAEMKLYQRNADMLTPILKMFASEYANQNTYDAIQVHGGTGFMKDFPVERMYRDARILTIYEGTSQLQVVAAIRHILNGNASKLIESYEAEAVRPEFTGLRDKLKTMHAMLNKAVEDVKAAGNEELVDFHARRLVEMAGYTILGNLVLLDAERHADLFAKSAEVFIRHGESIVKGHAEFIASFDAGKIGCYKD